MTFSISVPVSAGTGPIKLQQPFPDEYYQLEGKISRAWAELDYLQRIILKRLKGLKFSNPADGLSIDTIFDIKSQKDLIDAIKAEIPLCSKIDAPEKSNILALIDGIGTGRKGSHLYGRRNDVIHSLWAYSTTGSSFKLRNGDDDWRAPPAMPSETELNLLLNDITNSITELERLTQKLK